MKPCKYLDFTDGKYVDCEIREEGGVRYWYRRTVSYPEAPRNVQFCGLGRGRINSILACYEPPGPCGCYVEPEHGERCEACKGAGVVWDEHNYLSMRCPKCGGTGSAPGRGP